MGKKKGKKKNNQSKNKIKNNLNQELKNEKQIKNGNKNENELKNNSIAVETNKENKENNTEVKEKANKKDKKQIQENIKEEKKSEKNKNGKNKTEKVIIEKNKNEKNKTEKVIIEKNKNEKNKTEKVIIEKNKNEKNKLEKKESENKKIKENKTEKNTEKKEEKKEEEKVKKSKKKIIIIIFIIVVIIIMLALLGISTIPALITRNGEKITTGVSINGINVEGLTFDEAKEQLTKTAEVIINSDIKIVMGEYENNINLSQISATYNFEKALEEAHDIGRESNIFKSSYDVLLAKSKGKDIDIEVELNEEELNNVFNNISQELPGHVTQWSYSVENGKTLIITKGKKGIIIEEEETKNRIKEALIKALKGEEIESIELATKEVEPDEIDVEKIHEEVYREPQNAYVTQDPFGVYVHVDGIDFDIDKVKELVKSEDEEYKIDLTITSPEITTKDLGQEAFPDVLGRTYKTTYSAGDVSRNTNIEIAARTVNGIILMPGETFSYNGILGDTTADKGYKPAGAYLNGQVIQSYGGGICQVSSTIYNAVLYANLQVDERYNHTYLSGYVPAGLDATVSYGSKDFKFTNNRKYPIKLECTAGGGVITATIYGVKQDDDVDVELQSVVTSYISPKVTYEKTNTLPEGTEKVKQAGSTGSNVTVYITKSRNGEQISHEVLHSDVYSAKPKIILQGTKKASE